MSVDLFDEAGAGWEFDIVGLTEKVIKAVLDSEGASFEPQISVRLVDDGTIREINRDLRGIDSVTDVLSFPLVPFKAPSDFSVLDSAEGRECVDPDSGEVCLGDMVIACGRAKEQAASYGHSEMREIAFLTAHSMLHLLGYDHEDEAGAELMEEKQESVLKGLGITRESDGEDNGQRP